VATAGRAIYAGDVPAESLPFILLMPLTAHAGVQGESVGLGDAFQSGIRAIHWTDGANHEGLAPLLRADGDPVGDGTAEDMEHSIGVVCGIEVQPGVLGILLQQALSFQAAPHALANQLDQFFQLGLVRCLNALKAGRTIVATHVNTIQEQNVEVDVEEQPH
jgi:hypothetical protein